MKGMTTPSSILAWIIPWPEGSLGLQSMEFQVRQDRATKCMVMEEHTGPSHQVHGDGGAHISSVQSLSRVRLFVTPWAAARQASLSITTSWSLFKHMSIQSAMPSAISSSVVPFSSRPQSFPASGSFPVSQFFTSGGQSVGVSQLQHQSLQ